ncbi:MAG: hypothetical protein ACRDBG_24360, partial [Waterburya sp.]
SNISCLNLKDITMTQMQPIQPNLSTDPEAVAAYDEPGSWGRLSEGWPSTPYSDLKWVLCTQLNIVPYGQYVVVDVKGKYPYDYSNANIRCASTQLRDALDKAATSLEKFFTWTPKPSFR